jgi:hypothetical protein
VWKSKVATFETPVGTEYVASAVAYKLCSFAIHDHGAHTSGRGGSCAHKAVWRERNHALEVLLCGCGVDDVPGARQCGGEGGRQRDVACCHLHAAGPNARVLGRVADYCTHAQAPRCSALNTKQTRWSAGADDHDVNLARHTNAVTHTARRFDNGRSGRLASEADSGTQGYCKCGCCRVLLRLTDHSQAAR